MEAITDVSPAAVDAAFAEHGVDTIIHGHTHRPAVHQLEIDGSPRRRIVLGDWYEQGSVLPASPQGSELSSLAALPRCYPLQARLRTCVHPSTVSAQPVTCRPADSLVPGHSKAMPALRPGT